MNPSKHVLISLIKILFVILAMILLFIIGLMVGYGVIGSGEPTDVFNRDVWVHIADFIKG